MVILGYDYDCYRLHGMSSAREINRPSYICKTVPLYPQDIDIIKKSLVYYFDTLVKFSAEEALPEITKIDLLSECKTIAKAEMNWKVPPRSLSQIPILMRLIIPNLTKSYVRALNSYHEDLTKSMKTISSLCNVNIPLRSTDKDLQLVQEALAKIPDCEYTLDENE